MSKQPKTVKEIVQLGGGVTKFSQALDISSMNVARWQVLGKIPRKHWGKVMECAGCSREALENIEIDYRNKTFPIGHK